MTEIDPNDLPPLPIPELRDPSKPHKIIPNNTEKIDVTSPQIPARYKAKYFLQHIDPLPWHLIVGRTDTKNMRQVRLDLVSGLGDQSIRYVQTLSDTFTINNSSAKQITHFHPLSPAWAEGSHRSEIHAHFFHQSHAMIKEMLEELEEKDLQILELKNELKILKEKI